MGEFEKMLRGDPYNAADPVLVEARVAARRLTSAFNCTDPADSARRAALLKRLLGGIGEESWVEAPLTATTERTCSSASASS